MELEQDACLRFLEVVSDLARGLPAGRTLPEDIEGYVRRSIEHLLINKVKHDRVDRRRVPYSVEKFEHDHLGQFAHAEADGLWCGLDYLMEHHRDEESNWDAYQDVQEAVETREFWRDVDHMVGTENRVALVDAHVLEMSQRQLAKRLGRSYEGTRMHLVKLRARLRAAQGLAERAGDGERQPWHKGRRRRGQPDTDV